MMKAINRILIFLTVLNISVSKAQEFRGNPVITSPFTADPCPLVYNDTLYLFTGHDEQNTTNKWFFMRNWYVFSTPDMYNYKSHGASLTLNTFSWVSANAFAGHCIERNGKFYWYISATHKDIKVNEGFAIGVAVADHPTGPYVDAKGSAIVTDNTSNAIALNIDPAVFIDDDGQAYLYWGSWGACRMVKLKENMIDMDGTVQTVSLKNFFEAPFVHKKGDMYYMTYAGSGYPSKTEYATSSSPAGPWIYRGVINDLMPVSETNHQGIIEFKGNWYFVYHSSSLPTGGVYRRSVCIDKLEYTDQGLIKKVVRTTTSVPSLAVSVDDINTGKEGIEPYPNPSYGGTIHVPFSALKKSNTQVEIRVYSLNGSEINLAERMSQSDNSYNLNLNSGFYIVTLSNDEESIQRKLVIY